MEKGCAWLSKNQPHPSIYRTPFLECFSLLIIKHSMIPMLGKGSEKKIIYFFFKPPQYQSSEEICEW